MAKPLAQLGARQVTPIPGKAQPWVFMPSHTPLQGPLSPEQGCRVPAGAPATAVHVPSLPFTLHAPHWSVHGLSQQ